MSAGHTAAGSPPDPTVPSGTASRTDRWGFPRWALFFMVPGVLAPLLILGFILRTEWAHDEARCPYRDGELRTLAGGVAVLEQVRTCLPDVQERRYLVVRGDERTVLGRRRFAPAAFAAGYSFEADVSEQGEVRVLVHCPGHPDQPFREGTEADERGDKPTAWQNIPRNAPAAP